MTLMYIKAVVLFFTFVVQVILFPVSYTILLFLLKPLKFYSESLYWKIEHILYDHTILIVSYWTDLAGHEVLESGENVAGLLNNKNCIVMINHQCPSDIGIVMRALYKKENFFHTSMWVMDWIIQFCTIGWVSKGHGDFFLLQPVDAKMYACILSKKKLDQDSILLMKNGIRQNLNHCERNLRSVLIFPEGGFFKNRKAGSDKYAYKIRHKILRHVALPRVSGFEAVLKAMEHKDIVVIDMTIGYHQVPSLYQHGMPIDYPKQKFHVHYRSFNLSESSLQIGDSDSVRKWIFERFTEKDELLSKFYQYKAFPSTTYRPAEKLPVIKYVLAHFWAVLTLYFVYFCVKTFVITITS